jgi:serine/threonine protein kinase
MGNSITQCCVEDYAESQGSNPNIGVDVFGLGAATTSSNHKGGRAGLNTDANADFDVDKSSVRESDVPVVSVQAAPGAETKPTTGTGPLVEATVAAVAVSAASTGISPIVTPGALHPAAGTSKQPVGKSANWFTSKYELKEVVGEGLTSKCCRVVRKADGAVFACKIVDRREVASKFTSSILDQLAVEVKALDRVRRCPEQHPHIVRLEDYYETSERSYLVMEMVSGANLLDFIVKRGSLHEGEAASITRQLVSAVQCLHRLKIVHCDVKPENILVTSVVAHPGTIAAAPAKDAGGSAGVEGEGEGEGEPFVKIIDFGLSNVLPLPNAADSALQSGVGAVGTAALGAAGGGVTSDKNVAAAAADLPMLANAAALFVDTLGFHAPELVLPSNCPGIGSSSSGCGYAADMWAVGVVAYVILVGCMPFERVPVAHLRATATAAVGEALAYQNHFKFKLPMWAAGSLSPEAKDFLQGLLETDPLRRWTAEQALGHPWLAVPQGPSPISAFAEKRYLLSPALLGERERDPAVAEGIRRRLSSARREMQIAADAGAGASVGAGTDLNWAE